MAINRFTKYGTRWEAPTPGAPLGAFKNKSAPGALDGSYIDKDWQNDFAAFFDSLLDGDAANGLVDEVGASQYYDKLKEMTGSNQVSPLTTANGYFRSGMVLATSVPLPAGDNFAASEDIVFDWKAGASGCDGVTVDDGGILFSAANANHSIVTSVELGAGTQITDASQLTLYLMDDAGLIHYIKNGENSIVIEVAAGVATFEIKSGVFADLGITSIKRAFGMFEVGLVADLSEQGVIDEMRSFLMAARSWQDVSGDRVLGVVYTNNTPVDLCIAMGHNPSSSSTIELDIDGVTVSIFEDDSVGTPLIYTLSGVVPPWSLYTIQTSGSNPIEFWSELRI